MTDPFRDPAKGCPPCREGDHFGCWEDERPGNFYDADEMAPRFVCECAEGDH